MTAILIGEAEYSILTSRIVSKEDLVFLEKDFSALSTFGIEAIKRRHLLC